MQYENVPLQRLGYFKDKVGLLKPGFKILNPYRKQFASRAQEYGRFFYEYFLALDRTSLVLQHMHPPRRLEKVLSHWFADLFNRQFDEVFLKSLWRSGVKHTQAHLDQRYINLAYAVTRQFCHQMIKDLVPPKDQLPVAAAVDKMLDFCVLVETDSFITGTSRCDRSVIDGIAHQVRNPITVIGGNIRRLQRQMSHDQAASHAMDIVLAENQRLEKMVQDISTYVALYQCEPELAIHSLKLLLEHVFQKMAQYLDWSVVDLSVRLDPAADQVLGDFNELVTMLQYLLENCLEALDPQDPLIRITSTGQPEQGFVLLEIFNTGQSAEQGEAGEMFVPFHSSKPLGTGFGLPIADLVARRNLGSLELTPGPDGGTMCRLTLPTPARAAAEVF